MLLEDFGTIRFLGRHTLITTPNGACQTRVVEQGLPSVSTVWTVLAS